MRLIKLLGIVFFMAILSFKGLCQESGLSDTIDVIHYNIHLDILELDEHQINGFTDVRLTTPLSSINEVVLELKDLNVSSVLNNETPLEFEQVGERLYIELENQLNQGEEIILHIEYSGEPFNEYWGGFHFAGEYAFNLGVGFESDPHNLGKAWFPCVDDFNDRALYDFHIRVDDPNMAVCGGSLIETIPLDDNTTEYHWQMVKTIPTYLASVAVGEYQLVEDVYEGIQQDVPITYYVRASEVDKVAGSFVNMHTIMGLFESHWGAYPFERIGYVSTAKGAMEHAANIAYPYGAIDGGLNSEWWYTHELAHMWFGDMVTCSTAGDMWLNEGWARYCETFMFEGLYGVEAARDRMNGLHRDVLNTAHTSDGGYLALYDVPTEYTYGATVYDKGGCVVHTLRHYLGDDLFFPAVKSYLNDYAYNNASSYDLRDHLTQETGVDLTDFFNGWVFNPGFPAFEVDSFNYIDGSCTVYMGQKLRESPEMFNSNKVDVTFMDAQWNQNTQRMEFSGETGLQEFQVPFEPVLVMADFYDHITDATIDVDMVLKETGEHPFSSTYFKAIVNQISDSAFIRVSYNMVAPDTIQNPLPGLRISPNRYWKVEGILPDQFSAGASFFFNSTSGNLDNELFESQNDEIVLLYREDNSHDWSIPNYTVSGPGFIGNLLIEDLKLGEYTVAVWDEAYIDVEKKEDAQGKLEVYPNPSDNQFYFSTDLPAAKLKIWDVNGKMVEDLRIGSHGQSIVWDPIISPKGMYFVQLINEENNLIIDVKKLVYQ